MITKMTKYSFILLSKDREMFIDRLSELGVVDITRSSKAVDERSAAMIADAASLKKGIALLEKYVDKDSVQSCDTALKAADIVAQASALSDTLASLNTQKSLILKEIKLRSDWGEADFGKISALKEEGYFFHFYICEAKKFAKLDLSDVAFEVISDEGGKVCFAVISSSAESPVESLAEISLDGDVRESQAKLAGIEASLEETLGSLKALACFTDYVKKGYENALNSLDLYLAGQKEESAAEGLLSVYVGFAPTSEDEALKEALGAIDGLYFISEAASHEDNPPIKFRNNSFAQKFEVITSMYGMPAYGEWDPTPILSVFFMFFFAICMGDAGYGVILVIYGLLQSKKIINISMFDGLGPLITILGAATAVVGFFLGTAFGVSLYDAAWMPEALKGVMLKGEVLGYDIQMVAALVIGVVHLCLAMSVKAVLYTKRFGFKSQISTWGWLLLILGGITIAALAFGGVLAPEATKWAIIIVGGVSALGIYIFNQLGRNPLINIGAGLWDTYGMATGLLGDLLSYIRLYALGLAGGMLGNAFNDLGAMVLGDGGALWVPYVVILLLGHTLNLLMSCLGAFVHPLRLNFVEYFKNAGYEGSGSEYNPLKKNN